MKVTEHDIIFTIAATPYLSDGTIGATTLGMEGTRFVFDTGSGSNIINKSALRPGWEHQVDEKATPVKFNDANGRLLGFS